MLYSSYLLINISINKNIKIANNKFVICTLILEEVTYMNSNQNNQLKTPNLKVLSDQLSYEALMNKKFNEYANQCTDQELKALCNEASQVHKQNFNNLKSYLDSHQ